MPHQQALNLNGVYSTVFMWNMEPFECLRVRSDVYHTFNTFNFFFFDLEYRKSSKHKFYIRFFLRLFFVLFYDQTLPLEFENVNLIANSILSCIVVRRMLYMGS